MTSLPARLRRHPYNYTSVMHEAAQEIERLEALLTVAVEALERIAAPASCGQPDWSVARAALANIKEQSK